LRATWLLPLVLAAACTSRGDARPSPSPSPSPTAARTTIHIPPAPLATLASPTQALPDLPGKDIYVERRQYPVLFKVPSGNVGCFMTATYAECSVAEHTWPLPPKPADCTKDWTAGATLDDEGLVTIGRCSAESLTHATEYVYYDRGFEIESMQCVLRAEGVICRYADKGGFLVGGTVAGPYPGAK
jgi:hypothetical protein